VIGYTYLSRTGLGRWLLGQRRNNNVNAQLPLNPYTIAYGCCVHTSKDWLVSLTNAVLAAAL
jgi:hypothetical protein